MNSKYRKIKKFLQREPFEGFTKKDLFIKNFMPNAWGQDIAALSNIAEALKSMTCEEVYRGQRKALNKEIKFLIDRVVQFAIHPSVNPWKKPIGQVTNFNHYGYYLEHLNIILACYQSLAGDKYLDLNTRVTLYLREESLAQKNAHARLIPHIKMRWCADQAAIIFSIWLYDKNNGTNYHEEPKNRWLQYMENNAKHEATGLYITEVMGVKSYSKQPRGCSHAYMCYYMEHFAYKEAKEQWELFKKHMLIKRFGMWGFREYLPDYKGKWTPDSGPIFFGMGIAATGLALKPLKVWGDFWEPHEDKIFKQAGFVHALCNILVHLPVLGRFALLGSDILATAILLSAETTDQKYL